ncbi:MAG: tyrosine-type recombinase/integrase, partial [Nanoarchaeota archaeon]|nr:tyrosine-type recombinase/integrase [Nanoarchaeota archaeon]
MNKGKEIKLNELSEHKLKRLITKLSDIRKKKYIRRKDTKYGNINKGFTDNEIKRFFDVSRTHNEKCFVSFFLMGNLGLRIGEVVKIKLDDIDLVKNKIRISTEKSHTGDFLYLHKSVRKCLIYWFEKHQEKILKNEGYVLFSNNRNSKLPHVTPEWLRKKFREICYLSDLNEHYGFS